MKSRAALLIFFVIISGQLSAKTVSEYLSGVEPMLQQGRLKEAEVEFSKFPMEVRKVAVFKFDDVVEYLKLTAEYREFLQYALEHPEKFELIGRGGIGINRRDDIEGLRGSLFAHEIQQDLPEALPFSADFCQFINQRNKSSVELYNQVASTLLEARNAVELEERKTQEAEALRQKEARVEVQRQKALLREERQKALDSEIQQIDEACKKAGYREFSKLDMISMVYLTQKDGGLEDFLNTVVGNLKNDASSMADVYSQVKIFQVLDEGSLYTYSKFIDEEWFEMTVFVENEAGKLYQEGQSLEDTFHVFSGMYTYRTTINGRKTVPAFRKAKINLDLKDL